MFTLFETSTPQLYLDIDRTKAQLLGVNVQDVFNALQVYIGSVYVNDFNLFGRTYRVTAQAREMVCRVSKMVQGVQLSAPFGRYQMAIDVAEAIEAR